MSMESKGYKDPKKYEAYLERQREYKARKRQEKDPWYDPDKARKHSLKNLYGITLEEYDRMFFLQSGKCAICGNPETSTHRGVVKRLAVDHCHGTGRVRGLLCSNCNRGLGLFRESIENLSNAINYLQEV